MYESVNNSDWYHVKTYSHFDYPNMLGSNTDCHHGYLSYYGIAGRYYKAYVCVWGGTDSVGDSRYFWTGVKQAY